MNLMDDYEVIKQIGKGSFSNVYLCKQEIPLCIGIDNEETELFIIKEININELVKSYVKKSHTTMIKRVGKSKKQEEKHVNITPYDDNNELVNAEQEYYFKRLRELIESEIEILSSLDHPNIIRFYGYTETDGIYYLRMEYCNGGDVYDFLKNPGSEKYRNEAGGFTNSFFYEFVTQTVSGLKYIHDKNIVHRDIKLHNVLIKNDNDRIEFKISDFGFACYDLCSMNSKDIDIDNVLCKKYYKLCGTPYYMAPEIILNINQMENIASYKNSVRKRNMFLYNKKIDIWSLGICMYELMFNLLPFSNIKNVTDLENFYNLDNIQDIMNKKINRRVTLKTQFRNLLLSCIRVDKNYRCSVYDINKFLQDTTGIDDLVDVKDNTSKILDVINCRENAYVKNEGMKQHVVRNPVQYNLDLSWEKINKSSSLIMKMSVKRGFLDWLFNKS